MFDPVEACCPNFRTNEYAEARRDLTTNGASEDDAIKFLEPTWKVTHRVTIVRELRKREERDAREAEEIRQRNEIEVQRVRDAELEEEEARKEEGKKNCQKFFPIPDVPPPAVDQDIITPYTQRKLDKGHYVEIYYFTNEGLEDAKKSAGHAEDETMNPIFDPLTNAMSWVPAAAKRDTKSCKDDEDLSIKQLSVAISRMLVAIEAAGWDPVRIKMLATFWGSLLSHELRYSTDPLKVKAVIAYQASQRRLWHQSITAPKGAWNIGILSEDKMRKIVDEVYDKDRKQKCARWGNPAVFPTVTLPVTALFLF